MTVSLIRTAILYIVVMIAVRIMGKRQVGELQNSELVITLLISNLAAIPMQETGVPLISGLIPILVLVVCELLVSSGMLKMKWFRNLVCGHPVVVVRNGKLQQKAMKQLRFTVEDLMEGLRLKDVFDLSSVEFAAVETNGQLSVLLKPEQSPPTAQDLNVAVKNRGISVVVISNGKICSDSLELCGKTEKWVLKQVESEKLDLEDVFLMTADKSSGYYLIKRSKDL